MIYSYSDEVITVGDLRRFLAFVDREGIPDNAKLGGKTTLFRKDLMKLSVSGARVASATTAIVQKITSESTVG